MQLSFLHYKVANFWDSFCNKNLQIINENKMYLLQSIKELQTNKKQVIGERDENYATGDVIDSAYHLRHSTIVFPWCPPERFRQVLD